ncbi:hypothetical protein KCP71_09820 [Salmonella enterica subsp. enterica]|nr:hypothetical protein KCP71_09820 [Salmonella enterica subsp. enterica]
MSPRLSNNCRIARWRLSATLYTLHRPDKQNPPKRICEEVKLTMPLWV